MSSTTYVQTEKQAKCLGPVVQSLVSLTSSLRVISLNVLVESIYNILIFFAEKSKSYSHFFSKKLQHICISLNVNFNESLTKDVVSFEQLGPVLFGCKKMYYLELCNQYCFHIAADMEREMNAPVQINMLQYTVTVNVLKFRTLYSLLFWPKLCFLCTCFLKYLVEWQTVYFIRNFGVRIFRTFTVCV